MPHCRATITVLVKNDFAISNENENVDGTDANSYGINAMDMGNGHWIHEI